MIAISTSTSRQALIDSNSKNMRKNPKKVKLKRK